MIPKYCVAFCPTYATTQFVRKIKKNYLLQEEIYRFLKSDDFCDYGGNFYRLYRKFYNNSRLVF